MFIGKYSSQLYQARLHALTVIGSEYKWSTFGEVAAFPIGDSTTLGLFTAQGYRQTLFNSHPCLVGVGPFQSNPFVPLWNSGYSGIIASTVLGIISLWYSTNPAPILLLELGSNDVLTVPIATDFANTMMQIVDTVRAIRSDALVIIMQPIGFGDSADHTSPRWIYQPLILQYRAALTAAMPHAGAMLIDAPVLTGTDYPSNDGTHPSQQGYDKMAASWGAALATLGY